VALTRITVRSPPWNRSTVSMADCTGSPLAGSRTHNSENACWSAARLRPVRDHDPQPVHGVHPPGGVSLRGDDAEQFGPLAVEHLLGRRRELGPLGRRQPLVHGRAGVQHQPVALPERGQ